MSDDNRRDDEPEADKEVAAENRGHATAPDPEAAADDGDEDRKTSLFKKPKFWIILIIVVAVVAVGAVLYWLHSRQYESTDDAFIDAHVVRLAPQVSGTLIQVAQVDNRHVEAGRLLAVIRPASPEAQVAEANANVQQAVSQEKQAEAQVTAAIAARDQAAAQARAPIAEAAKAAQDLARYQELARIDRNAVAGQQLDQARAQAKSTAAQAAAARQQIDNTAAQIAVARKQVAAAEAMITARQAQAKQAQVNLGDYRITAPVAGQVVNRSVNLGSYVAPGMNLMAIVPDRMWVTANFKETQLTEMRIGQPVSIKVDAFPDVEFKGHVDSIQRGAGQAFSILPAQNATGNYVKVVQRVPVRIEFDTNNGPDPRKYPIGPGMSVVPTVKVR